MSPEQIVRLGDAIDCQAGAGSKGTQRRKAAVAEAESKHYMTQPLVELYGVCMVVLKVS